MTESGSPIQFRRRIRNSFLRKSLTDSSNFTGDQTDSSKESFKLPAPKPLLPASWCEKYLEILKSEEKGNVPQITRNHSIMPRKSSPTNNTKHNAIFPTSTPMKVPVKRNTVLITPIMSPISKTLSENEDKIKTLRRTPKNAQTNTTPQLNEVNKHISPVMSRISKDLPENAEKMKPLRRTAKNAETNTTPQLNVENKLTSPVLSRISKDLSENAEKRKPLRRNAKNAQTNTTPQLNEENKLTSPVLSRISKDLSANVEKRMSLRSTAKNAQTNTTPQLNEENQLTSPVLPQISKDLSENAEIRKSLRSTAKNAQTNTTPQLNKENKITSPGMSSISKDLSEKRKLPTLKTSETNTILQLNEENVQNKNSKLTSKKPKITILSDYHFVKPSNSKYIIKKKSTNSINNTKSSTSIVEEIIEEWNDEEPNAVNAIELRPRREVHVRLTDIIKNKKENKSVTTKADKKDTRSKSGGKKLQNNLSYTKHSALLDYFDLNKSKNQSIKQELSNYHSPRNKSNTERQLRYNTRLHDTNNRCETTNIQDEENIMPDEIAEESTDISKNKGNSIHLTRNNSKVKNWLENVYKSKQKEQTVDEVVLADIISKKSISFEAEFSNLSEDEIELEVGESERVNEKTHGRSNEKGSKSKHTADIDEGNKKKTVEKVPRKERGSKKCSIGAQTQSKKTHLIPPMDQDVIELEVRESDNDDEETQGRLKEKGSKSKCTDDIDEGNKRNSVEEVVREKRGSKMCSIGAQTQSKETHSIPSTDEDLLELEVRQSDNDEEETQGRLKEKGSESKCTADIDEGNKRNSVKEVAREKRGSKKCSIGAQTQSIKTHLIPSTDEDLLELEVRKSDNDEEETQDRLKEKDSKSKCTVDIDEGNKRNAVKEVVREKRSSKKCSIVAQTQSKKTHLIPSTDEDVIGLEMRESDNDKEKTQGRLKGKGSISKCTADIDEDNNRNSVEEVVRKKRGRKERIIGAQTQSKETYAVPSIDEDVIGLEVRESGNDDEKTRERSKKKGSKSKYTVDIDEGNKINSVEEVAKGKRGWKKRIIGEQTQSKETYAVKSMDEDVIGLEVRESDNDDEKTQDRSKEKGSKSKSTVDIDEGNKSNSVEEVVKEKRGWKKHIIGAQTESKENYAVPSMDEDVIGLEVRENDNDDEKIQDRSKEKGSESKCTVDIDEGNKKNSVEEVEKGKRGWKKRIIGAQTHSKETHLIPSTDEDVIELEVRQSDNDDEKTRSRSKEKSSKSKSTADIEGDERQLVEEVPRKNRGRKKKIVTESKETDLAMGSKETPNDEGFEKKIVNKPTAKKQETGRAKKEVKRLNKKSTVSYEEFKKIFPDYKPSENVGCSGRPKRTVKPKKADILVLMFSSPDIVKSKVPKKNAKIKKKLIKEQMEKSQTVDSDRNTDSGIFDNPSDRPSNSRIIQSESPQMPANKDIISEIDSGSVASISTKKPNMVTENQSEGENVTDEIFNVNKVDNLKKVKTSKKKNRHSKKDSKLTDNVDVTENQSEGDNDILNVDEVDNLQIVTSSEKNNVDYGTDGEGDVIDPLHKYANSLDTPNSNSRNLEDNNNDALVSYQKTRKELFPKKRKSVSFNNVSSKRLMCPESTANMNSHVQTNGAEIFPGYVKEPDFVRIPNCSDVEMAKTLKGNNISWGLLKILPGGTKSNSILKSVSMSFLILSGVAELFANNQTILFKKLNRIYIPRGTEYSIRNASSEEDLLMEFCKFSL